jgi:hypothetical protein
MKYKLDQELSIELLISTLNYKHLFTIVQTLKCSCELCCEVHTQFLNLET